MACNTLKIEKLNKKITGEMNFSSAELLDYYNKTKENYFIPERAKVTKISFEINYQQPNKIPDKALECYNRALKGENLSSLVAIYSKDDNEKANKGADTVMKGMLDKEIDNKIFALKPSGITDIVKNQNYYFIYQMDRIIPPTYHPFNDPDVQRTLKDILSREKYSEMINNWVKEAKTKFDQQLMKTIKTIQ